MKIGIAVFPGSNCDRDMFHLLRDVYGTEPIMIWHTKEAPEDLDVMILPGGFSYADRLRSGVIAAHSPIIESVRRIAKEGKPILGVCNGFQILVEAGILPGALVKNNSLEFMSKWTDLVVENNDTPFTRKFEIHQKIPIPVANGEGKYYVDENTLQDMKKKNQVVFRYAEDINGSTDKIAGICNEEKNVVGMMPHPERAAERMLNPYDHRPASLVFESFLLNAVELK